MALRRFTEAGLPDPIRDNCVVFFDDFTDEWALTSNEPVTGTSPWIGTALSSGTTAFSTNQIGGVCILANDNTNDNSGSQIQQDVETFQLQANKDLLFGCRFQLGEATESHFFAGLVPTDTTMMDGGDGTAALTGVTAAGLGLFSQDGSAALQLVAWASSAVVGQTTVIATMSASTWYNVEFLVKGSSTSGVATIYVYVNGTQVTTVTYSGMSTATSAVTMSYVSGAAGAATVQQATIDWVAAAAER